MTNKSGFVSIIGKPNVGKSTLLNSLIGEEISIVTSKPQTTRNNITGIYTKDNVQIIFLDTPGILKPKYHLQNMMEHEIKDSVIDSDIIMLVLDASKYNPDNLIEILADFKKDFNKHTTFCILNKIDLVRKEEILHIINDVSHKYNFNEIFPVSSRKYYNVEPLLECLIDKLPEHPFFYLGDGISDQPVKFFVSEIIRGSAMNLLSDELPFSVFVEIEEFSEREFGKDYIKAKLILDKESHKKIFIGKEGQMLTKIGSKSRKKIEEFLQKDIFLELFVNVRENWKNDKSFLKTHFKKQSFIS